MVGLNRIEISLKKWFKFPCTSELTTSSKLQSIHKMLIIITIFITRKNHSVKKIVIFTHFSRVCCITKKNAKTTNLVWINKFVSYLLWISFFFKVLSKDLRAYSDWWGRRHTGVRALCRSASWRSIDARTQGCSAEASPLHHLTTTKREYIDRSDEIKMNRRMGAFGHIVWS